MKKIIVKNLDGIETHRAEMEDPSAWIADCLANNYWGQPERAEVNDDGQPTGNILPAEYTVEIIDITEEYNLQQALASRRSEYPSAEEFLNAFFDGGDEALEALRQRRLAVKAKYPKNQ